MTDRLDARKAPLKEQLARLKKEKRELEKEAKLLRAVINAYHRLKHFSNN